LIAFGNSAVELRVMATFGFEPSEAEIVTARLGRIFKNSIIENQPVIVSNLSADARFEPEDIAVLNSVRTLALLPLALPSGGAGILYADRQTRSAFGSFNQGELNLLTLVCNLASLSVVESQRKELLRENLNLKNQLWNQPYPEIVTQNARMIEILRMVEKIADCPASILIEGETGTGKGLIAQALHNHSQRKDKPFIQVNCAALPEPLLESELFGHVQGAFTGAVREKTGLFKEADGGTLFLDEVDKTTETLQAKLLHVLDKHEIRPVGSTRWQKVNTRVICATNVDLKDRIRS
jgi:transcriptional regulator with GAF, ATPase, and Fis domain